MLRRESSEMKSHFDSRIDSGIRSGNSFDVESRNLSPENTFGEDLVVQSRLCSLEDLADGEKKEFSIDIRGQDTVKVLLIKNKGKWYALGAHCTYCNSRLVDGILSFGKIRCSFHGTSFNIKNGKIEDPPGFDSLPFFTVKLSESEVYISTLVSKLMKTKIIDPMTKCKNQICDPTVIIGAGIAGITVAESLRQEGYGGRIVILSKEKTDPYNRSLLTKNIVSNPEELKFRDPEFYSKHDIELLLGTKVKSINTDEKVVHLEDEKELNYSNLVLAMGSVNKSPSINGYPELEGVFQLRNFNDLKTIKEETEKKHVTIVGTGYSALEITSLISKSTRSVTILGKSEMILRQFGPFFGRNLRAFIEDQGKVSIRQGSLIRSLGGYDRVSHLVLKDGLCAVANTVIVCTGTQPCTSILLGSKIQTTPSGYVTVDENMETNQHHVFAVGDLTEFPLTIFGGRRISLQHVNVAQYQAKIVARKITKRNFKNEFVPFFWIDLFEKHVTFCGDCSIVPEDFVVRGTLETGDYRCYMFK
ncbi:hypothetical protein FO519_005873 [Halicephalobus sp. NKZ332]|nr:hypothetical protein FO519_005873 [Halicephalobus sp. NKZ332]